MLKLHKKTGDEAFYAEAFDCEVGGKASAGCHVHFLHDNGCLEINDELGEALGPEWTLKAFDLMKVRLLPVRHIILRRCASVERSQDESTLVWEKYALFAGCVRVLLYNY